jgi:hypothetical protein
MYVQRLSCQRCHDTSESCAVQLVEASNLSFFCVLHIMMCGKMCPPSSIALQNQARHCFNIAVCGRLSILHAPPLASHARNMSRCPIEILRQLCSADASTCTSAASTVLQHAEELMRWCFCTALRPAMPTLHVSLTVGRSLREGSAPASGKTAGNARALDLLRPALSSRCVRTLPKFELHERSVQALYPHFWTRIWWHDSQPFH